MDNHIGFLRLNKNKALSSIPNEFNNIFYVAPSFGFKMILFSPNDVNFDNNTINGKTMENGIWKDDIFPMPTLVDNSILGSEYNDFISSMKNRTTLLRHNLKTSKQKTYDMLLADGKYSDILIPTTPVQNISSTYDILDKTPIIIKHKNSGGGRSIYKFVKINANITMIHGNETTALSPNQFEELHVNKFQTNSFVIQPFIESTTKLGEPFDIRIHCARGPRGKFVVTPYPRIGSPKGVVSNIATGGYTLPLDIFLRNNFGNQSNEIMANIKTLGSSFPEYYCNFFDVPIFDIGLDIGIDTNGNMHLFEVNTYISPTGFKLAGAITQCQYYQHILDKDKTSNYINVGVLTTAIDMDKYKYPTPWMFQNLFNKKSADEANIKIFAFARRDISINDKTINGRFYDENGKPYREIVDYPHIVDNISFPKKTITEIKKLGFYNQFESLMDFAIFTRSLEIYPKEEIYNKLHMIPSLKPYLNHTEIATSSDNVLQFLKDNNNQLFIKPSTGARAGANTPALYAKITLDNNMYYVYRNDKDNLKLTYNEFVAFINAYITATSYCLEPYIDSLTKCNKAVLIRMDFKRGSNAILKHISTSCSTTIGTYSSPFFQTSQRFTLDELLEKYFNIDKDHINKELEILADILRNDFTHFDDLLIFNYGIDIGLSRRNNKPPELKIFEINLNNVAFKDIAANKETCYSYYKYLYDQKYNKK